MQLEADQREKLALADQLTQIAATVPGAIFSFLLRPDGSCAMPYLAGRLVDTFGIDPVELREDARPVFDFLIPDDLPLIWQSIELSASTLQPLAGAYRVHSPQGKLRWIEVASIPQPHPEGGVLWHGYLSDVTERTEAAQLVAQSRDQLQELANRVEQVREEERTRIARELHDDLGQMLTSIKMHLRRFVSALQYMDQPLAREMIDVVRMTDETTHVVRRIVHELRPKVLDTLDLGSAIAWEVGEFRKRQGIRCQCSMPTPAINLPEAIRIDVYRLLQEALTNIARHAMASRVDVRMSLQAGQLTLCIEDNGVGIEPQAGQRGTMGLLGMNERAHRMGGSLLMTTRPNYPGTRYELSIPLLDLEQVVQ
jgi:two-component system, NarL family, sensor histidine kinase UhpB